MIAYSFILSLFLVPKTGHCQRHIQLDPKTYSYIDWSRTLILKPEQSTKNKSNKLPISNNNPSLLDKPLFNVPLNMKNGLHYGGGDSGGGSGLQIGENFRLKDFKQCQNLRSTDSIDEYLIGEMISENIFKPQAGSIKEIIKKYAPVSNQLLEKIIWAAAARANWYFVNADLQINNSTDKKIALFKKPVGIIVDNKMYNKLATNADKAGLLFHETLRMVSLGFQIALSTTEIEDLTCQIFSNQKIELEKYQDLNNFLKKLTGEESTATYEAYKSSWITTFESISELKDLQFMPSGGIKTFFYQLESSKFESFRQVAPSVKNSDLENVFFSWAALEGPSKCHSKNECSYSEYWPTKPYQTSKLRKWDLIYKDANLIGWSEPITGLNFVTTINDLESNQAAPLCKKIGDTLKIKFEPISSSDLARFSSYLELNLLIHRENLSSILGEEAPLLAENKDGNLLWMPSNEIEQGYSMINSQWNSVARLMCIHK